MWNSRTKDIGQLEGKLLLFGGPYSNLHALQSLKQAADQAQIPAQNIICTGDIVGYCAYPSESLDFIRDWGIHAIYGNVEYNLIHDIDDCGCNFTEGGRCDLFSRQWYPYAKSRINEANQAYLNTLPEFITFGRQGKRYHVLHGGLEDTSAFIFASTEDQIKTTITEKTGADVIIGGHCGLPFIQQLSNGSWWLNAGVIGMPANDGKQTTWYAIADNNHISFHTLDYDHTAAANAMRQNGLPGSYANTLETGIWDNCEILPETEAKQQGRDIEIDNATLI